MRNWQANSDKNGGPEQSSVDAIKLIQVQS